MKPDMKVSRELQEIANELQKRINEVAGQEMLFSLVIYQAEDGSRMNYISNADRKSVARALSSLLYGWGEGMPDIPAHKVT